MKTTRSNWHKLIPVIVGLIALSAVNCVIAAGGAIGLAAVNGSFLVDHSAIRGNTSLFEGSTIETGVSASDIQLNNGVQIRLAADSRATIYEKRLLLESGLSQISGGSGFETQAKSLRVSADRDSVARVKFDGTRAVTVAAVRGSVRVRNATGILVATVAQGMSLDLEPQAAGASAPTRASGCMLEKAGKVILVEQTTAVVLELHGMGFDQQIGNRVRITGMAEGDPTLATNASQSVRVTDIQSIGKGGCSAIAKKIGAAAGAGATTAAAGAASGTGAPAGAAGAAGSGVGMGTIAVIGGVAAAATVGGLAAVGSLPGQGGTTPSASR